MFIPPQLVAYLIFFKDFQSEKQASEELAGFYQTWDAADRQEVVEFAAKVSKLDESDCRRAHRTGDSVLDAEIVRVKSYSTLYEQIDHWLSEAKARFG